MSEISGTRLYDLRKEKGDTQEQLANALGVSRSLVKAWENEERRIKTEDLVRLANYFGVSCDYLLGRTDISSPSITVQEICRYTGLSEKAVANLNHLYQFCPLDGTIRFLNRELSALDPEEVDSTIFSLMESYIVSDELEVLLPEGNNPFLYVRSGGEDAILNIKPFYREYIIATVREHLDRMMKEQSAPGADTPGADAGQKASGPLPSQDNTDGEV